MPHFMDGAAKEQVAQQPMAVAGHGDEVAFLGFGGLEDFPRRIAQRQVGAHGQAFVAELRRGLLQVFAVGFHLLRLSQFKLFEVPRDPPVRYVDQQQLRVQAFRQLGNVRQQAFVRLAVFQSYEDFLVHGALRVKKVKWVE